VNEMTMSEILPVQRKNIFGHIDVFAILAFTIPLCIYLLTLAPSVTFFDSGEFLTAVSCLGSPHSPGYPLFVNYAKPFTFLPFGDIAFRVNLATAVSASLCGLGVYLLAARLMADVNPEEGTGRDGFLQRASALSAALIFAFSPRLWLQSNHDKPYPLLTFLAALIFWLILLWREEYRRGCERPGRIYLAAFLCGLALGAHQTIVLMIPSLAYLILSADWRLIRRVKEQVLALSFFFVGCSVYLHMPVRAMERPVLNWGDPKTLSQFLWSFLRKGYPMEQVDRDLVLLLKQLAAFNIVHEINAIGLFLLLVGAVAFRRRHRDLVIAFGIALAVFLAFVVGYQNTPEETIFLTEEFFTPLYMLASVFAGLGLYALSGHVKDLVSRGRLGGRAAAGLVIPLLTLLPVMQCVGNYRENNQHDNYLAYDYAVNTFRSLPRDAVLFTWGDSGAFPLWYLQGVERMREDLVLLHVPHLQFGWYLDAFPQVFRQSILRKSSLESLALGDVLHLALREQLPGKPVYFDFSTRYSVNTEGLSLRQRGICYEVRTGSTVLAPDVSRWDLYSLRGVLGGSMPFRDLDSEKAVQIYAYSRLEAGRTLLALGRYGEGEKELIKAGEISPAMRGEARRILEEYGARR